MGGRQPGWKRCGLSQIFRSLNTAVYDGEWPLVAMICVLQGAEVAIFDIHAARMGEAVDAMNASGGQAHGFICDVGQAGADWIAHGAVFLAGDESRYMTGQHLTIDGSYVMDGSLPGPRYWED